MRKEEIRKKIFFIHVFIYYEFYASRGTNRGDAAPNFVY